MSEPRSAQWTLGDARTEATWKGGRIRRARRRGGGMATLAELVYKVVPHQPEDAILFRIMAFWERALPHRMVKNARPVSLRRGVLFVHATTSAWAQEVTIRSRDILDRLRRGVPKASITELRVRTGQLPERIVPPPREEKKILPVEKLPMALEVALENMEDPKLRELFEAAARTSLGKVVVVKREDR